jgi:hypothetical protein
MLEIKGMKGGGYYNQFSGIQSASVRKIGPWLRELVATRAGGDIFEYLDLGSSNGHNTLLLADEVVRTLREQNPQRPIRLTLNDLPSNDWKAVALELYEGEGHSDIASHGVLAHDIYTAFAAGSMFSRPLVPPGTIDLAVTTIAIHWLSHHPDVPLGRHLVPNQAGVSAERRSHWRSQSDQDLRTFLGSRSREIKTAGALLIVWPAEGMWTTFVCPLQEAIERAAAAGNVPAAMLEDFSYPVYFRTPEEFEQIYDEQPIRADFNLERLETLQAPDPGSRLAAEGNLDQLAALRVGEQRAVAEGLVDDYLSAASVNDVQATRESLFAVLGRVWLENPKYQQTTSNFHAALLRRR